MQAGLKSSSGSAIIFGAELGRGGEGAVYALRNSDRCVKIYHQPLTNERVDKIRLMSTAQTPALLSVASWPLELVLDAKGSAIGLMMPRVSEKKDVHELYSPKSRRSEFLRADWRFLIRTATNIARAFAAIHHAAYVIGDVNHGSVLVGQDARVTLVDCDSFQVTSGSRRFLCDKGVETYTPPELQGKSFAGVVRTVDHDNFGLAVLIFHLLMMGRHPFAGRFSGAGDMPLTKAIAERRFAYSRHRHHLQMERPPGTPDLSIVGQSCADLFERAFTTREANSRPMAELWVTELGRLETQTIQCRSNEAHWYLGPLTSCPWCQMERLTGSVLFPFVAQSPSGGTYFDVVSFTQRLYGLTHLGPAPTITKPSLTASAMTIHARRERRKLQLACLFLGSICALIGFLFGSALLAFSGSGVGLIVYKAIELGNDAHKQAVEKLKEAQKAWATLDRSWSVQCDGRRFEAERAKYGVLKQAWDRLPQDRLRRLDQLKENKRKLQLEKFLDQFRIEHATIPGVGPGRKAILASEGIESAYDVEEAKLCIPSFGPVTRAKILAWRSSLEAKFIFDPSKGVDAADVESIERAILAEKRQLETRLREQGDIALQEHAKVVGMRKQMLPQTEAAMAAWAQAEADMKVAA